MNFRLSNKQISVGVVGLLVALKLSKGILKRIKHNNMMKISKQKKQIRDLSIQQYVSTHSQQCTLTEELKDLILKSSISQLKDLLYNKTISVRQLLLFFIERTLDRLSLNLITEINFYSALQEADQLDELIAQNREVVYQYELFGIPISIKDTIQQKGFDTTYGMASRCNKPEQFDSIQVQHIKQAKGICFVRSNIPQCCMIFESSNQIFGQAKNPWDRQRTPGGSSGGEAGLVASGCVPIGLAADMGGSIRIPSSFCGVYGFVPSVGRISELGEGILRGVPNGIMNIKCSKGPIGRCVDDLIVFTSALFNPKYYENIDPKSRDFFWVPREMKPLPTNKLKIGVLRELKQLIPPNCMKRAVDEAAEALRSQGHEVVEFEIDEKLIFEMSWIFLNLITAEGGFKRFEDALQGEKPIDVYSLIEQNGKTPNFIRKYLISPLLRLLGQKTIYNINYNTMPSDVYGYQVRSGIQKNLSEQFFLKVRAQGIDAIILPAFGLPAIKHETSKQLPMVGLYTWIWNTLNLTMGTLPVTVVKDNLDQVIEGKQNSRDIVYKNIKKNMVGSEGLPVNVQVLAFPNQEETCLKVMKDIESGVNFKAKHPYPF